MIVLASDLRNVPQLDEMGNSRPKLSDLSQIGVIAEIMGVRDGGVDDDHEDDLVPFGSMMVKLVGRQRCKILECIRNNNG